MPSQDDYAGLSTGLTNFTKTFSDAYSRAQKIKAANQEDSLAREKFEYQKFMDTKDTEEKGRKQYLEEQGFVFDKKKFEEQEKRLNQQIKLADERALLEVGKRRDANGKIVDVPYDELGSLQKANLNKIRIQNLEKGSKIPGLKIKYNDKGEITQFTEASPLSWDEFKKVGFGDTGEAIKAMVSSDRILEEEANSPGMHDPETLRVAKDLKKFGQKFLSEVRAQKAASPSAIRLSREIRRAPLDAFKKSFKVGSDDDIVKRSGRYSDVGKLLVSSPAKLSANDAGGLAKELAGLYEPGKLTDKDVSIIAGTETTLEGLASTVEEFLSSKGTAKFSRNQQEVMFLTLLRLHNNNIRSAQKELYSELVAESGIARKKGESKKEHVQRMRQANPDIDRMLRSASIPSTVNINKVKRKLLKIRQQKEGSK